MAGPRKKILFLRLSYAISTSETSRGADPDGFDLVPTLLKNTYPDAKCKRQETPDPDSTLLKNNNLDPEPDQA